MNTPALAARTIRMVLPAIETSEGDGMIVRRPFPNGRVEQVDPFLLLDEMGPVHMQPGHARGAPDHPHRGFETVSYILEGELEHEDSVGNRGILRAGDVQWMTAGRGVVHSEMPSRNFQERGGRLHGFQLWVNLPSAHKLIEPRYQELPAASIPVFTTNDGLATVKIVAGSVAGHAGAVQTHTPMLYAHLVAHPGAVVTFDVTSSMNAMVYGIAGRGVVGNHEHSTTVVRGDLAVTAKDGAGVELRVEAAATVPFEALVLAGEPINEPLARYGPFVMNTREEIVEAYDDFQAGRLGQIVRTS